MLEDTSFSVTKRFLEQHGVDTNKSSEIAGAIYLLGGTPKDIYANKDSFVSFKNKPEYVYMDKILKSVTVKDLVHGPLREYAVSDNVRSILVNVS